MSSVMVTVEVEVEVFYNHMQETVNDWHQDSYEAVNAICQSNVPREVSEWAENQAITQFEKNPARAIKYAP